MIFIFYYKIYIFWKVVFVSKNHFLLKISKSYWAKSKNNSYLKILKMLKKRWIMEES